MNIGFSVKQLDGKPSVKRSRGPVFLLAFLLILSGLAVWWFGFQRTPAKPLPNPAPAPADETAKSESRKPGPISKTVSPSSVSEKDKAVTPPPVNPLPAETVRQLEEKLEKAKAAVAAEEYQVARDLAREIVASGLPEGNPLWESAASLLGQADLKIINTDIPVPEKVVHNVKSGDSLDQIAKSCNSTIETIQRSNGLDSQSAIIHPGMQMRIYKGDWRIVVSKKRYRLFLYDGPNLFKIYPVGIGRQNRTPAGTFVIAEKVKEPTWDYKGKHYAFGDKENVLGSRWMRLEPTGETNPDLSGYGIHGTWEPDSIGTSASNGCVRLRNEDVEELFDIIPKYSKADGRYVDVTISED